MLCCFPPDMCKDILKIKFYQEMDWAKDFVQCKLSLHYCSSDYHSVQIRDPLLYCSYQPIWVGVTLLSPCPTWRPPGYHKIKFEDSLVITQSNLEILWISPNAYSLDIIQSNLETLLLLPNPSISETLWLSLNPSRKRSVYHPIRLGDALGMNNSSWILSRYIPVQLETFQALHLTRQLRDVHPV